MASHGFNSLGVCFLYGIIYVSKEFDINIFGFYKGWRKVVKFGFPSSVNHNVLVNTSAEIN